MKTKFTFRLNMNRYIDKPTTIDEMRSVKLLEAQLLEEHYMHYSKKYGWILDKKTTTLYKIFDEPLYFNIDDDIDVGEEYYKTISNKTINLADDYIEYEII